MAERILIVDDEETLCEALRFNLDAAGYETAVAHSAEEALATDLSGFSLILLDIMMGEISGVQLARIIRNNAATARIPIIFCTAKDGEEDMIEGLDLGADDYITKPYSLRNVLARIRSVLRRCPGGGGNTSDTYGRISFEGLSVDTPGETRRGRPAAKSGSPERNSRFFPCFCETVAAYSPAKKSLPASGPTRSS